VDTHFTGPFREQFEHFQQRWFIIDQQDGEQGQITPLLLVQ
jgi:hypothetical protein